MLAFAIGTALAVHSGEAAQPAATRTFDLPPTSRIRPDRPDIPLDPVIPRNLDTRGSNAPEAEWRVAHDGPVFSIGAMGGRRAGRPKLAHVAMGWSF